MAKANPQPTLKNGEASEADPAAAKPRKGGGFPAMRKQRRGHQSMEGASGRKRHAS